MIMYIYVLLIFILNFYMNFDPDYAVFRMYNTKGEEYWYIFVLCNILFLISLFYDVTTTKLLGKYSLHVEYDKVIRYKKYSAPVYVNMYLINV